MKNYRQTARSISALILHKIPLSLAAICLFAAISINIANVIGRYFFSHSFFGAEEAMTYLFIWSVFLAASAVAYDGAALCMDLISSTLPDRFKTPLKIATTLLSFGMSLFVASLCWTVFKLLITNMQKSIALGLPMFVPQLALLIGFMLIALGALAHLLGFAGTQTSEMKPDTTTEPSKKASK